MKSRSVFDFSLIKMKKMPFCSSHNLRTRRTFFKFIFKSSIVARYLLRKNKIKCSSFNWFLNLVNESVQLCLVLPINSGLDEKIE